MNPHDPTDKDRITLRLKILRSHAVDAAQLLRTRQTPPGRFYELIADILDLATKLANVKDHQ